LLVYGIWSVIDDDGWNGMVLLVEGKEVKRMFVKSYFVHSHSNNETDQTVCGAFDCHTSFFRHIVCLFGKSSSNIYIFRWLCMKKHTVIVVKLRKEKVSFKVHSLKLFKNNDKLRETLVETLKVGFGSSKLHEERKGNQTNNGTTKV
jgi:hypothetical protein